nr:hypothetical protein L203_03638 [Cryptococcus depauperatus CBS 7841]
MQAQQASQLHTNPDGFFSPGEYILGDADMLCTPTVIAMFRSTRGQADLNENQTFFNSKAVQACVTVEQAFGMLKVRFSILCSANMRMILTINAACILHNLLVRNWRAVVDVNDLQDIMHEEREVQAERLRHEEYFKQFPEQYRRR